MPNWPKVRLGDLVEIKHGFAFDGRYFGDEPARDVLVTPGNFAIGGGFKADKLKFYRGPVPDAFVLRRGDLLVTMTDLSKTADTLGYPAIAPGGEHRWLHNQRIGKVAVTRPSDLDPTFLYYLFRSRAYRDEVLASATGTTVKHTSPRRIAAFRFRLPPVAEQRAIAGILGALDDKIELNRRMNETLETMARAVFKSWFVDFDPVRAKSDGRQPAGMNAETAALFSDSFVPTKGDPMPRGWKRGTMAELAFVSDCLHSKKPDRRETGRPLLQLWNIRNDGILDMTDPYWVSEGDYAAWISRIEATPGDCVVTNVGRVGAVAQIPAGMNAALGRNMTAVRCRPEYPFPTFLVEALLSDAMREEISLKTDSGTILDSLNVRNIPRLQITLAPKAVLERFERLCRPLRAAMETNHAESRTLADLRDTLLPRLLSGAVRVRPVEGADPANA